MIEGLIGQLLAYALVIWGIIHTIRRLRRRHTAK